MMVCVSLVSLDYCPQQISCGIVSHIVYIYSQHINFTPTVSNMYHLTVRLSLCLQTQLVSGGYFKCYMNSPYLLITACVVCVQFVTLDALCMTVNYNVYRFSLHSHSYISSESWKKQFNRYLQYF